MLTSMVMSPENMLVCCDKIAVRIISMQFCIIIMHPTSKKLRRHIGLGLSVRLCMPESHFAYGQERLEMGS